MLEFVSKTVLCIDVYLNDKFIGELINSPINNWDFHSTGSYVFDSQYCRKIADKLDELNKGEKKMLMRGNHEQ